MTSGGAGATADRYVYDALGNAILRVGTTANVYGHAGEPRDPVTGLDYLRARYLSPGVGRFITRDTYPGQLRTPLTLHRYLLRERQPGQRRGPVIASSDADRSTMTSANPAAPGRRRRRVTPDFGDSRSLARHQ